MHPEIWDLLLAENKYTIYTPLINWGHQSLWYIRVRQAHGVAELVNQNLQIPLHISLSSEEAYLNQINSSRGVHPPIFIIIEVNL